MNLWFTTSVGAGADAILAISVSVPAHVPDMFHFGCPTDDALLNSLSFSSLPVFLASDSMSCIFCYLNSSRYFDCSLLI